MKKLWIFIVMIMVGVGIMFGQVDTAALVVGITEVDPGIIETIVDGIFGLFAVAPWWLYVVCLVVLGLLFTLRHFGVTFGKIGTILVDYLEAVTEAILARLKARRDPKNEEPKEPE